MIPETSPDASGHPGGGTLTLAGIQMAMEGPLCPPFDLWPATYQPFLSPGPDGTAAAGLHLGPEDRHPTDEYFHSTYVAGSWKFGTVEDREVYRFHTDHDRAYLWAEPDADSGRIEVWIDKDSGRKMPPLLHPVDRVLSMGVLANRGGFIVHSCGWSCQGRALLFPGVSGAGKTTLCRQLMTSGQGVVLSDDRVILREGPEGFRACGTPWPGDAKQALNESAPLAGICFIEKSPEHHVTPIRPGEALRRLAEAASIPWFSPALRDLVLPIVERLVSAVPAYRLGFHPEPGVVEHLLPLVGSAG